MSILGSVLRGILGAVDRSLNQTVSGNGGDAKVRRLQEERQRYKAELDKHTGQSKKGTN